MNLEVGDYVKDNNSNIWKFGKIIYIDNDSIHIRWFPSDNCGISPFIPIRLRYPLRRAIRLFRKATVDEVMVEAL